MEASLYMYSIICFIGFILVFMLKLGYKENKNSSNFFLVFFLLLIIAPLLVIFKEKIPFFLSVIGSNSLFIIAYTFLYLGVSRLIDKKANMLYIGIISISFLVFMLLFTYVFNDIKVRIVILNVFVALILIKAITDIQSQKKKWSLFDEFMSMILIFLVFTMTIRTVGVYIFNEDAISFLDFNIDPIFLFIIGIVNLLTVIGILSIYQNITSRELQEIQRSNSSLISNLPGFAYRCCNDEQWTMVLVSKQAKEVTGWNVKELLNNAKTSYEDVVVRNYRQEIRDNWNLAIKNKTSFVGEYQIEKKSGEIIWVWEQGIPIYETDGSCKYIEGFIMDIDNRKLNEHHLEYLSFNDVLTGLYNRRYSKEKYKELQNNSNFPISLIMGDIDNLKFINDSFSHEEGDKALKFIAKSLVAVVEKGTVVRLGGDEFLIILPNSDENEVNIIMERIHSYVSEKAKFLYQVSISLGAATALDNKTSLEDAEKQAENNMYKQKLYSKPSSRRNTVDAVLQTLFKKDKLSEIHSQNVATYCKKLAEKIGLAKNEVEKVETAALFHDIGKIIISKRILTSKKSLTPYEWTEIKNHPEIGFRILHSIPELHEIANYVLHHHERIDGSGYPNGIKGDQIPTVSKIISICDAFDAMINKRFYKEPMSLEEVKKEFINNSGTQFDSELTKQFLEIIDEL